MGVSASGCGGVPLGPRGFGGGHTPLDTPPHGQQVGGIHAIGMLSCFLFILGLFHRFQAPIMNDEN